MNHGHDRFSLILRADRGRQLNQGSCPDWMDTSTTTIFAILSLPEAEGRGIRLFVTSATRWRTPQGTIEARADRPDRSFIDLSIVEQQTNKSRTITARGPIVPFLVEPPIHFERVGSKGGPSVLSRGQRQAPELCRSGFVFLLGASILGCWRFQIIALTVFPAARVNLRLFWFRRGNVGMRKHASWEWKHGIGKVHR